MQALQRVHSSRSIGLPDDQVASNAPRWPREAGEAATVHRQVVPLRQCTRAARRQHRDLERCAQHGRGVFGRIGRADDQATPGALVGDGRHRLGRGQLRRGDECGDLRRGRLRVLRPAAGLADVDEADRPLQQPGRARRLLGQLEEQPHFLGAGHQQVLARPGRLLKRGRLAPAQGAVDGAGGLSRPALAPGAAPGPGPWRPAASSGCSRRSGSSCGVAVSPSAAASTGRSGTGRSCCTSSSSSSPKARARWIWRCRAWGERSLSQSAWVQTSSPSRVLKCGSPKKSFFSASLRTRASTSGAMKAAKSDSGVSRATSSSVGAGARPRGPVRGIRHRRTPVAWAGHAAARAPRG